MHQIWIYRQKHLKLPMGIAGSFFELHLPNLVRINFLLSCKNAGTFVVISQVVSDLAKISESVPSIYWGVLAQQWLRCHIVVSISFWRKDIKNLVCQFYEKLLIFIVGLTHTFQKFGGNIWRCSTKHRNPKTFPVLLEFIAKRLISHS